MGSPRFGNAVFIGPALLGQRRRRPPRLLTALPPAVSGVIGPTAQGCRAFSVLFGTRCTTPRLLPKCQQGSPFSSTAQSRTSFALAGMGASASTPEVAAECFEERDLRVPNLGDSASLKRCVDDAAALVVMSKGYDEDHFHCNVRITLGSMACAFALVAQFWPSKFPDNWALLACCVAGYIVSSFLLNWYSTTYEGDAILFTAAKQGGPADSALRLSTLMQRYSDKVTIVIGPSAHKSQREPVQETYSVTQWFDVNGVMAKSVIRGDVEKLLNAYEAASGAEPKKSK